MIGPAINEARNPDAELMVINHEDGTSLPLQPLLFWDFCERHPDIGGHCFIFDKKETKDSFIFKAVGYDCKCEISIADPRRGHLAERLVEFNESDQTVELLNIDVLNDALED